jgi:hypothetical protein
MALLALIPAAMASGCAGPDPLRPEPGSSSSTTPDQAQTTTPEPSPSPAKNAGCRLTVTISDSGREQGGAGHSSTALLLRNNGSAPCSVHGYPAVIALDPAGRTVAEARQTTSGYMGGLSSGQPPAISLAPGQAASALFETLNANSDGTACQPFAVLRVTPPVPQSEPVTVTWGLAGCADPQIHPVVPGDTGRG